MKKEYAIGETVTVVCAYPDLFNLEEKNEMKVVKITKRYIGTGYHVTRIGTSMFKTEIVSDRVGIVDTTSGEYWTLVNGRWYYVHGEVDERTARTLSRILGAHLELARKAMEA